MAARCLFERGGASGWGDVTYACDTAPGSPAGDLDRRRNEHRHLRRGNEAVGDHLHASDGEIGPSLSPTARS
jgi:hypothetical protein